MAFPFVAALLLIRMHMLVLCVCLAEPLPSVLPCMSMEPLDDGGFVGDEGVTFPSGLDIHDGSSAHDGPDRVFLWRSLVTDAEMAVCMKV